MEYNDLNGNKCELSFEKETFPIVCKHVLVICKFEGKWLLTHHPLRGLEFPGGKVEQNESLPEAAIREVYEETGAVMGALEWFAEYMVYSKEPFCKTVFIGKAVRLDEISLLETNGAVLREKLEFSSEYSFLMKDEGMKKIAEKVEQLGKWND